MPKFLEERLARSGRKSGKTGRALSRYVYGAMNNQGYMRGNKITSKGREAERKHAMHQRSGRRTRRRTTRY